MHPVLQNKGTEILEMAFATHKAASEWFSGKQLGLANGLLAMGMGVGFTLGAMISATVLSPILGNWRNVMFAYGILAIVIGPRGDVILFHLLRLTAGTA